MAFPQSDYQMSEAEYLAFERESEIRHEFVDGEIYATTGASNNHIIVVGNLQTSLNNQLRDSNCLVMSNDLRVKVEGRKSYRYPDLTVICDDPEMIGEENPQSLLNPTIIIEVLSASTASVDHIEKREEYFNIPTVEEYLLISQNTSKIERYLRQPDNQWLYSQVSGLQSSLDLPSIGCTLALSDVYRKVRFDEDESSDS